MNAADERVKAAHKRSRCYLCGGTGAVRLPDALPGEPTHDVCPQLGRELDPDLDDTAVAA